MEEAIASSLAMRSSSASHSPVEGDTLSFVPEKDVVSDFMPLILQDTERLDQGLRDHEAAESLMMDGRKDLDQKLASENAAISDSDWEEDGDNYEKPYEALGSSSCTGKLALVSGEFFEVYCKGLISEETIKEKKVAVSGIGVAICDSRDNVIFEVNKGLDERDNVLVVQFQALIEGLNAALVLDLKRISLFFEDSMVYQFVTGRIQSEENRISTLVNEVSGLQNRFTDCRPFLIAFGEMKFAYKLARDAIVAQIAWSADSSSSRTSLRETCSICYENTNIETMFTADSCLHRYCFSCMKKHVEVKLLNGMEATCPHDGCQCQVSIEKFGKFLDPKLVWILSQTDSDLAFQIQLQEAINASLAALPSSSSPPPPVPPLAITSIPENRVTVPSDMFEQELNDWRQSELKMRRIKEDHDRGNVFRLYFKGLVSQEIVDGRKVTLAGIGVAICDPEDNLVFEVSKALTGNGLSRRFAEAKALIEGLNSALALELKRITIFCDYEPLYQYVTGKWPAKERGVAMLVNQVSALQRKFTYCNPTLVASNDIKFASQFARDAIVSQITKPAESNGQETVKETCAICLEDIDVKRMYSVDKCRHRYCFSCMKQHVEAKLLQGTVPKCPHEGCKSKLNVESSKKFLTPKLVDTMHQRIKEASIPATERVYCPYPKCSALMSKLISKYSKMQITGSKGSNSRVCMECRGRFCIICKVPWHKGMTCDAYKRRNPNPPAEDVKLKSLANRNLWRQCVICSHMIELSEGCYHMTCRCGFEFCYNCGAEWKDKKATCACPLWDEDNIWDDPDEVEDEDEDFFD